MEHLATEEATKNALVLPVLNALGYNVFDPTEVVPEFIADVATKKGEKVDYVLKRDGKPVILIECKPAGSKLCLKYASQLFRYFSVTDARFAILTNGIDYEFYTDIEAPNRMDEKPFFEFSMLSLEHHAIEEIKKFSKASFDIGNILSTASELKYKKQIKGLISKEMDCPTEDFVKHFTRQVYNGSITTSVKEQFTGLVRDAFRDYIKDRVNQRIQSALDGAPMPVDREEPCDEALEEKGEIETTPEEVEGFQIVRAILARHADPSRIVMRDTKSYCGVLLDDNNRKPLCRLRFNYSQKYIGLFNANKEEERVQIAAVTDIYKYESRLVERLQQYDIPGSDENESSQSGDD